MVITIFQDELFNVLKRCQSDGYALSFLIYLLSITHPSKGVVVLDRKDIVDQLEIPMNILNDLIDRFQKEDLLVSGRRDEDQNLFQVSESLIRLQRSKEVSSSKNFFDEQVVDHGDPIESVMDALKNQVLRKKS